MMQDTCSIIISMRWEGVSNCLMWANNIRDDVFFSWGVSMSSLCNHRQRIMQGKGMGRAKGHCMEESGHGFSQP